MQIIAQSCVKNFPSLSFHGIQLNEVALGHATISHRFAKNGKGTNGLKHRIDGDRRNEKDEELSLNLLDLLARDCLFIVERLLNAVAK